MDNKEWWDGYYNETSKMMHAEWIFRGNADSRWELIPSALRTGIVLCKHPAKCAPLNNNHEQISAEFQLIKNFRLLLDEGGLPIPEDSQLFRTAMTELEYPYIQNVFKGKAIWPHYKYLSLMALAQHYGIPTRLLDWTHDPYVAAYFAAKEAALWLVGTEDYPKGIETLSVWAFNSFFLKIYQLIIKRQLVIVTAPAYGNPNLHAQKGLFTLERHSFPPNLKVCQCPLDKRVISIVENNKHLLKLPIMIKFTIPISASREILRRLSYRFINAATLYPGFDGAAEALKEQRLWDKM